MNPSRGRSRGRGRGGAQGQNQDYRPGGQQQQQRRHEGQQQYQRRHEGQQQYERSEGQQQRRHEGQQQYQRRHEGQQQYERRPERHQQYQERSQGQQQQHQRRHEGQQQQEQRSTKRQMQETPLDRAKETSSLPEMPQKSEENPKEIHLKDIKSALENIDIQFNEPKFDLPLARKPKPGTLGRKFRVVSNLFPMKFPTCNIFHYDVEIVFKKRNAPSAGEESTSTIVPRISASRNREVVNKMLDSDEIFENRYAVYDGMKNLYSMEDLGIGPEPKKFEVLLERESGFDENNPVMDTYDVFIKPVQKKDTNDNVISLAPLQALFQGRTASFPQESVMALETILRYGAGLRYIPVGRSFFYPPHPNHLHPLGGGKEIWFGYHQSMRLGQWAPLVNLDISATAFYESGPLINFVSKFLDIPSQKFHSVGCLREQEIKRVEKELKTLRIHVTHLSYQRKYRVIRLTRRSANDTMIEVDGARMSVAKYFANTYRTLQYPHLPCVQGNPEKKNIFLPMEVCHLIQGQHVRKKLDDRQTAEMIKYTKMTPAERIDESRHINNERANFQDDSYVCRFEISVDHEPVTLVGRELPAPTLEYGNQSVRPKDGQWEIRGKQYLEGASVRSWGILCYANPRFCSNRHLEDFAKLLCRVARDQGMEMGNPATIEFVNSRNVSAIRALTRARDQFTLTLAVVVLPKAAKAVYTEVKQAAELQLGMATQCVLEGNVVNKCKPALVSNLCQKINAKMGGVNNALRQGEVPKILEKPVIIIGADVSHPSPGSDLNASVAAVVGSLDYHPSRYAVAVRTQTNRDEKKKSVEVIQDLRAMVKELLMHFYRHTRKKPESIVFYRDGVSEGQFLEVLHHEVTCIRKACQDLEHDYKPGITFVVVQKRHHVRFMPENRRDGAGTPGNIPPGTCMDTDVVHPQNFDFFLCSHYGLQGTSRPCHYTVLHDDNSFTADDMQKLTYYLCHTYARCTKSISCPVPVQYAHLAAYRARHHLQSVEGSDSSTAGTSDYRPLSDAVHRAVQVDKNLKDSMYFV